MSLKKWVFGAATALALTVVMTEPARAQSKPYQTYALIPRVCDLKYTVLRAPAGVSAENIESYKAKLDRECALSERYLALSDRAFNSYGITLDDITEYQTLRYVQRSWYESAKVNNTPVPVILQIWKKDHELPVEKRKTVSWDNWSHGILQLDGFVERIAGGRPFLVSDLQVAHRFFYQYAEENKVKYGNLYRYGDESGDYSHDPIPGYIKQPHPTLPDGYWWPFNDDEGLKEKAVVDALIANYRAMGLYPNVIGKSADDNVNDVLRMKQINGKWVIYGGDTRANGKHLELLLGFINTMVKQAAQGQHMVWNGRLMTPGEVAFFAQQYFVHIHPFSEGNGRMSRFIQEVVLSLFALPVGSSGDLMDIDVLTEHAPYYETAIKTTEGQIRTVENCVNSVYAKLRLRNGRTLRDVDQTTLPYECRLLPKPQ
jgi:hypothetical protein